MFHYFIGQRERDVNRWTDREREREMNYLDKSQKFSGCRETHAHTHNIIYINVYNALSSKCTRTFKI